MRRRPARERISHPNRACVAVEVDEILAREQPEGALGIEPRSLGGGDDGAAIGWRSRPERSEDASVDPALGFREPAETLPSPPRRRDRGSGQGVYLRARTRPPSGLSSTWR